MNGRDAAAEHGSLTPGMRDAIRRVARNENGRWALVGPIHPSTIKAMIDRQLVNHWFTLTELGEAVRTIELNKEDSVGRQQGCSGNGKQPSETYKRQVKGSGNVVREQTRGTCPDNPAHTNLPLPGGNVQGHRQ